jgi:hypothetical protein
MARKYFTLAARDSKVEAWTPQFGDFDKECVEQELEDQKGSFGSFKFYKIISSGATQADINAALAKLNAAI